MDTFGTLQKTLTFNEYFKYHSPSFLLKYLYEGNQYKNDTILKYFNELFTDLRNCINSK